MAAASIVVSLLMTTGSFETDTQRAGRALQKLSKQSKDSASAIASEFKRVQDAITKAGMTLSQQKLFDLKQMGASQQQLVAYARNLEELDRKTKSLSTSTLSLSNSVKTAAGALGVGFAFSSITQLSDSYIKFTAQLKNATTSAEDFGAAYQNVQRVAQSTQFDIEAVGTTYSRLSQATRDLGISQQQVSDIVETIGLSLKTQGATTAEASSAMLQLSQAFGAGRLNGDEFRSAMENVPGLMRELAKEMGVPLGELKELAKEGKLTADVLVKAFSNPELLASLRDQAKEIRTISGGYAEIGNQLKLIVGETNNATGATSLYAKTLSGIAFTLEKIRKGGGFDSGLLSLIPGGQAFGVFNQAGRARPQTRQSSSGAISRAPNAPAAPSLAFEELSKGLSIASVKIAELVKTQEEAIRSLNTGKITYEQYKEIISATGKELTGLTDKTKKKTKANKEESDALKNFAKQQQDIANILQKARDLNAPEVSKFDQLQQELDAYTELNSAVREYAENEIRAAKAREQWEEIEDLQRKSEGLVLDELEDESRKLAEAQKEFKNSSYEAWVSLQTPVEQLKIRIQEVRDETEKLGLPPEFADPIIQLLEKNAELKKKTDELSEVGRDLGLTFSSAFEDAIAGAKSFSEILRGLEQDIIRIITRKLVTEPLAQGVTNFVTGLDFKSLFPSFDVGTPYVQRDMLANIHKGERILTAAENRAFSSGNMGGTVVNQYIQTPDANSFRKSGPQIAAEMQRALNKGRRIT